MIPLLMRVCELILSFPRVSGDDPLTASTKKYADEFSPRERG